MEKFNQIKTLISQIEADAHKFYDKGNSAAGTRLRKGMLALKLLATEVRKDVTARKHAK
ncbi:histone H1 [Pedobacter gandavensis]|uniref:Histone H1 n=1 Tax=Pedobacter gandavensis TaxID=2679963 RepID=A0ABR6EZA5_9SPHI|nr:histone H1 [Pedobacter gandavensis]MBB2150564.1 histone H1 [Pedobacter gandavensis]